MRTLRTVLYMLLLVLPVVFTGCIPASSKRLPVASSVAARVAAPASLPSSPRSSESRVVQASPKYLKAERLYAQQDYQGALALIDSLLAERGRTEADRAFLKDQRAICLKAISGKSTPTASNSEPKTDQSEVASTNTPSRTAASSSGIHEQTDCGPKALLYVCQRFKVPADLEELTKLCNPSLQGTTLSQLARAAKAKGLAAEGLKVDWNYLTRMPKPVIAWVRSNHYVVVLQTRRGRVHYYDPATGPIRNEREGVMTSKDFGEIWQGYVLSVHS